jgi:ADP-ribose pyrophosphatase
MDKKEKLLEKHHIFKGNIIDVYQDKVLCPNGNVSTRDLVVRGEACAVIAFIDGKLILEKQYRYPFDKEIIEIPAGKMEKGEKGETCALREFEEETGYKANKIVYLGTIYPSVAFVEETIHIYYAYDLIKTQTHLDENEFIDIYLDSIEHVEEQILNAEIVDAKTIAGIYMYKIYQSKQSMK